MQESEEYGTSKGCRRSSPYDVILLRSPSLAVVLAVVAMKTRQKKSESKIFDKISDEYRDLNAEG
jgi:hypothetical protein